MRMYAACFITFPLNSSLTNRIGRRRSLFADRFTVTKNDGSLRTRASPDRCLTNCARSRGPTQFRNVDLDCRDLMRARCATRRSGQGARRELHHMRLKNVIGIFHQFYSTHFVLQRIARPRALFFYYRYYQVRNEVIDKENTVISPVVVARSRDFAQQIKRYRRRR